MCKQTISVHVLTTMAVLVALGVSSQAKAQYLYQRYFRTNTGTLFPFEDSIDATDTYGSYTEGPGFFYSGRVAPANAPEEQVAYVHVRVSPPYAEISFDGTKTAQIGSSRLYVSPPLVAGENYTYTIRVRWAEIEGEVSQTRKIAVRAGDRLSVVFRAPASTGSTSTLQTKPGTQP